MSQLAMQNTLRDMQALSINRCSMPVLLRPTPSRCKCSTSRLWGTFPSILGREERSLRGNLLGCQTSSLPDVLLSRMCITG